MMSARGRTSGVFVHRRTSAYYGYSPNTRQLAAVLLKSIFDSGNSRTRLPVAAKIALQKAGANGGTPGSPTPAGGASLSIRCT